LYFEEIPVDMLEDEPRLARWLKRMSSIGRVISFNPRGLGLSDPVGHPGAPTLDERLDDAVSVLDATGCDQVTLLGLAFMGHAAIDMAARRPERTSSLVLVNARARWLWDENYTFGIPPEELESMAKLVVDPDAGTQLTRPAPSVADDPAFWQWWERAGHRRASPAMAADVFTDRWLSDVRALLPKIGCPTLVVQRTDVEQVPFSVEHGRYLTDHIPDARLVEVPGTDYVWWTGNADAIVDEIELFVSQGGTRRAKRVLATVLFVDVVGSTSRAAAIGDKRWHELLETHNEALASAVTRFGGRLIGTEGDGALATFDIPVDALECARAVHRAARSLDIDLRAGAHTGEIEVSSDDVAGLGVHIAARVKEHAGPGDVYVSRTVVDLVAGSGLSFDDRGEHDLKGVPGTWRLFCLES
jgi:class 3 adenylate cyclase/pimeloyl-ACP methyl ester carboxylesterase